MSQHRASECFTDMYGTYYVPLIMGTGISAVKLKA